MASGLAAERFTPAVVHALREMLRTGKYEPATGRSGSGNSHNPQGASGSGNGAAAQQGNGTGPGEAAADTPACTKCGGAMWDNRASKKNPRAPDFKCKKSDCDGVIWPAKQSAAAPAASPQGASGSAVPF